MIMKFTKQIAQALANKAKRELVNIRKERVKTFKVPEEITAQILQLSTAYFTAVGTMNSALKQLQQIAKTNYGRWEFASMDQDKIVEKLKSDIAESNIPKVPSIEDLTDDFLVESIDAANAEELISKVVSKYS